MLVLVWAGPDPLQIIQVHIQTDPSRTPPLGPVLAHDSAHQGRYQRSTTPEPPEVQFGPGGCGGNMAENP